MLCTAGNKDRKFIVVLKNGMCVLRLVCLQIYWCLKNVNDSQGTTCLPCCNMLWGCYCDYYGFPRARLRCGDSHLLAS